MKIIKNNPYRTIGLLVGAKAAEQNRQINRLKMYLEAEQEPQDDFSFPVLGKLHRSVESVAEAASKLNLDNDRMNAALFWFYKGNEITDEPAFDALKAGDLRSAMEIWSKLTSSGDVTPRNSSAVHNLSTLLLCSSFNGSYVNMDLFEPGLGLKLKFLESEFVNDLKVIATDETYKPDKKDIQLAFLNAIHWELEKTGGVSPIKIIEILNKHFFSAKEDFLRSVIQRPIENIEKKIEAAKIKRKTNKATAAYAGRVLYDEVCNDLIQLKDVLGVSNLKYSSIADKLSEEILQCGIDYFLHFRDTDTDPGQISMDLFNKAKVFAIGNIAKQRCQENSENLQTWINDKPERDKHKKIGEDLQFITSKLERFQRFSDTVANAKDLVDSCKSHLLNIKNTLGPKDDFYLKISSAIVQNAQGMLVTAVNEAQEGFKFFSTLDPKVRQIFGNSSSGSSIYGEKMVTLPGLSTIVNGAYDVTTSMQSMDMEENLRHQFQKNREALSNIRNQINSAMNTIASRSTSSSSGGGCYIATMAYGDYDHPQVIILRHYRDNILSRSFAGRCFVKLYYAVSPCLVNIFKDQKIINTLIRNILNQFIKLIKK